MRASTAACRIKRAVSTGSQTAGWPRGSSLRSLSIPSPPRSASLVYAGTDVGVFESTDGGASWAPINVDLGNPIVNALAAAPGQGGALYAATNGGGVFVLTTESVVREPIDKTPR